MLTIEKRNELILNNLQLADRIACKKHKNLYSVQLEDVKSAAYFGLVDAASKYTEGDFSIYAKFRVVGAIQDYLRELSWGSRNNSVAKHDLGDDYSISFHHNDDFFELLTKNLDQRTQQILELYYIQDLNLQEISVKMGVHKTRISQLIDLAKTKLKELWLDKEAELWQLLSF